MNNPTSRYWPQVVGLSLGLGSSAFGQAAAPTSNEASESSDPVVNLETFVVNTEKDNGYIAVDSLAGGRSNTPIKLTPTVMSSLTRTFIDDVGLTNVRDALKWSPNVTVSDPNAGKNLANPFNSWDYNFRSAGQSLQGGAGPTRNYFTFYGVADTYNLNRIEFDRGPNSILFGVGTVGGVLTTYTKQPDFARSFTTVQARVDSNGSLRGEFDVNRRVSESLSFRINAVRDNNRGWREGDKNTFTGADLGVAYKPTDNTILRLGFETAQAENTLISSIFNDGLSKWDGSTYSDTWGANPGVAGTRASQSAGWGTSPYNIWIPGLSSKGIMNWNGGLISAGIDPDGIPAAPKAGWYTAFKPLYSWMQPPPDVAKIPVLPSRDFTYGHGISKPSYTVFTAQVEHRLTDQIDAVVSFYNFDGRQSAKDYEAAGNVFIDLNRQLPDGSPNPNVGKRFADFFLSKQQQNRAVSEVRGQINARLEGNLFGVPVKQLFSASLGYQEIDWTARQYNAQLQNTGISDFARNMVWGRLYFDNPNAKMNLPEMVGGRKVVYASMPFDWFDFDEEYLLKNVALVSHTRLWDDKLSILSGVRHDRYEHEKQGAISKSWIQDRASGTTYSAGAIYYFKALGFFANASRNFDPIGPGKNNSLYGTPFGPATGEGLEYGVRLSTDDGKYYASVSRYDSKSKDRIFNGGKPDFAGIWRNYYDALGQTRDPARTNFSYDDTEDLKVTGWEVDVVANPTKNIRLSANFGKPDSEIVGALADSREYYARYLSQWNTGLNLGNQASTDLRNVLSSAQNTLDQNAAGKIKLGRVDYTASLFGTYTFTERALKGFSMGGGIALTGRNYVGDYGAPDGGKKYAFFGNARRSTSLVLAYDMKWRNRPLRLALNIDNALDDKDPIITGYHWGWTDANGRNIPNSYILPEPRRYTFSARYTF